MILIADRRSLAQDIQIARDAGARLQQVCDIAGIDARTLQRWKAHEGLTKGDGRPVAQRPAPSHALSIDERAKLLSVANEPRFCAVPPARIVPMLADEGVYLASESTFARGAARPRANSPPRPRQGAQSQTPADHPHCHGCTPGLMLGHDLFAATVIGRWFHLYLILDLYSRKIVGWEVHDSDHSDHAVHLVRRTALAEGIAALTDKPVLHGDNGSTLKATTVLAMLNWLGVKPSYSRPRVSDDNAYAESLFRTAKYRPEFPTKGFETLQAAREWGAAFVHWYNLEHKHSGIRYVSPQQRHTGEDQAILAARHALYKQVKQRHPARWARHTRDWSPVGAVTLNPERDSVIAEHVAQKLIQPLAA